MRLAGGGAAPPFFLISGAGGHVLPFQPMANVLAPRRTCVGVLFPGFFVDERDPQSVEEYAQRMLTDIDASRPGDPVLLFGYSFGGLVAFEIARLLHASGRACGLVVVDSLIPQARHLRSLPVRGIFRALALSMFWKRPKPVPVLGERPSGNRDTGLEERCRLVNVSADQAWRRYRPGPCPVPTVLIRALELSPRSRRYRTEPELGWGGGFVDLLDIVDFQGSHVDLFQGQNVESFATAAETSLGIVETAARRPRQADPGRSQS